MSYSNPKTCMYTMASYDFGAASGALTVLLPGIQGMTGRIVDVGVVLSEATVFATTMGNIKVGTHADTDAFANFDIATGQGANTTYNTGDNTSALTTATLDGDDPIEVTLTEGTGTGLTGTGVPYLVVDWY
jgi:hypothetical protein